MPSVTGIVANLPFPVLTSAWGTRPLPNTATEAAAIPHKQFPNLQNETGAVLRASNVVPAEKRRQDKPARSGRLSAIIGARGGIGKSQEIRNKEKTRRQE
jgi:hypothetical protein